MAWRMATRLLGVVSSLILIRLLAPGDFGLVALGTSFTLAVEALSWIGIDEGVIRHEQANRAVYDTAFTLGVIRGVLMGALVAALAYPAARFFAEPRLSVVILALAFAILLEGFENVGIVEFRREFQFFNEFRLFLLPRLASIVLAIGTAAVFRSYWALVAGVVSNRVLRVGLSYAVHPYRPRLGLSAWRGLAGYSGWAWALNVVEVARDRADSIMLGRMVDTTHVGLYAVGYELAELPSTELVFPLTRAAFPGFAAGARAPAEAGQAWLRLVSATALLTWPAGVGASALAAPLVALGFGPAWSEAVPVVQLLSLAFTVTAFGLISQTMFRVFGQMRRSLAVMLGALALRLVLLAGLIGPFGTAGAAVAAAVAVLAEQGLLTAFAVRDGQLSLGRHVLGRLWRCAVATGTMALVLYAARFGWAAPAPGAAGQVRDVLLGTALGAAVYGAVLLALWGCCRRPAGPEADVLTLGARLLRRVAG